MSTGYDGQFESSQIDLEVQHVIERLQGGAGNGWNEWKDKDGRTLNEMKRAADGAGM